MEEVFDFRNELNEAAGYMPYTLDLFDDSSNFRTKYKLYFEHVQALGTLTTAYLKRCAAEDEDFEKRLQQAEEREEAFTDSSTTFVSASYEQERLKQVYNAWSEAFILCIESMREIRHYSLRKDAFGTDENGYARKLKNTLGMHVFFELTRLYGLIHRPSILEEQDNIACIPLEELSTENYVMMLSLAQTKHALWISIVNTFDISTLYETKEDPDAEVEAALLKIKGMWKKPIMTFTQSEIIIIVFFMTQQLNDIPTQPASCFDGNGLESKINVVEEFRRIFHAVWLRCGYLMQETHTQDVLDVQVDPPAPGEVGDPEMRQQILPGVFSFHRNFATFCSFYLGELVRRFFYYDLLSKNVMRHNLATADVKALSQSACAWLTRVVDLFAEEAFEDMYNNTNPEGYHFVGDDGWFKYIWPQKIHSRGACITAFRPHLYKRFYSEAQLNKRAVLNSTKTSNVARLFVFRAIDEHIKIQVPTVQWLNAVLVSCGGIEMSAFKLETNRAPVIIQVFSSYWAYDKGFVHVCDDVFEAVGVWFWLLATRYNSTLYDANLFDIVKDIVPAHLMRVHTDYQQQEAARARDNNDGDIIFEL